MITTAKSSTFEPTTELAKSETALTSSERFLSKAEARTRMLELSGAGHDVQMYHGHRAWVVTSALVTA